MEKEHKGGMLGGGRMELWGGEQLWREQSIGMDGGWEILGEVSTLSHLASSSDSLPWASPHRYP